MKIELTEAEARLIKTVLQGEYDYGDLEGESIFELQTYLGEEKGEEMYEKINSLFRDTLSKFEKVECIDRSNGYDMGIAQIVDNNIFEQIMGRRLFGLIEEDEE